MNRQARINREKGNDDERRRSHYRKHHHERSREETYFQSSGATPECSSWRRDMIKEISSISELWKNALQEYCQSELEDRLKRKWPGDLNVQRISYQCPPTFQPGYVGSDYWKQIKRLLILSQNPGEGSD